MTNKIKDGIPDDEMRKLFMNRSVDLIVDRGGEEGSQRGLKAIEQQKQGKESVAGIMDTEAEPQILFPGLQEMKLSDEEKTLFRKLQMEFMKKDPETRVRMRYFFDLLDTYVTSKDKATSLKSLHKDSIIRTIFDDNNTPYTQWITKIFELFERDSSLMVVLAEYLQWGEEHSPGNHVHTAVYFRDYVMDIQ